MRLDVAATWAGACAHHGVEDFALAPFDLEGLSLLAEDAATLARGPAEVEHAGGWITTQIAVRVLLEKRRRADPRIAATPVAAPVFIIAPGRTGSTLLHWLLALEPSLRAPRLWELWSPMAAADPGGAARGVRTCEGLLKRIPAGALKLHPMSAQAPDECHWIVRHNTVRPGLHRVERYPEWLWSLDVESLRTLFEDYRRMVQLLQSPDPTRRWLSKASVHMHFWPVLFDVFPDARVIRLHREPRQAVASCCSLFQFLGRGLDPLVIGEGVAWATVDGLARTMAADVRAPPGQVIDVLYEELCAAPARVARELGRWLGIEDVEGFGGRVDRYLASAGRIRAAPNAPALEEFGLDDESLLDLFGDYIAWVRARVDPGFGR